MSNSASNVKFGKPMASGAIFCAPKGTTLPNDAATPLSNAFKCLGFMNTDGLKETINRSTEEVKAWGGEVVARPQTSYGKTYAFNCIEINDNTLEVVYGAENVSTTSGVTTINSNSKALPHLVWVFEIMLDANTVMRKVVSDGQVSEIGAIEYVDGKPITMPVTVAAFPDANGNYETAYKAAVSSTPANAGE